jgi:excisionase family DNA binding protein
MENAVLAGCPDAWAAQPPSRGPWRDWQGAAAHLDVTERFIRQAQKDRRLPFHKVGKFVRFHTDDLDAFARAGRVEAAR